MNENNNGDRSQEPEDYWHRRQSRIDEILESWKSASTFADTALKSVILLNGAAATAILAIMANKWGDVAFAKDLASIVPSLRHFVIGVFSAVLATGAAYLSAYLENRGLWSWVTKSKHSGTLHKTGVGFQIVAIVLVGYAYFRFWWGTEAAIDALLK